MSLLNLKLFLLCGKKTLYCHIQILFYCMPLSLLDEIKLLLKYNNVTS